MDAAVWEQSEKTEDNEDVLQMNSPKRPPRGHAIRAATRRKSRYKPCGNVGEEHSITMKKKLQFPESFF